jgi:DNA-binding SARP family transcriptional activator
MLRLYLFGAPRVVRNGQVVALGRTKSLALLAYLAVTRQPQEREVLLGLLWAELDQAAARNNLRRELSQLKHSFVDTLLVNGQQIAWNTQAAQWLDVAAFLEQIAAARQLPPQTEAWVSARTGAGELASDEFMAGFSLADSPQVEEWQFFERETLRQQLTEALQKLVDWQRTQGDFSAAIGYARRWLALDGLHEPAHRELMLLYALAGQQRRRCASTRKVCASLSVSSVSRPRRKPLACSS